MNRGPLGGNGRLYNLCPSGHLNVWGGCITSARELFSLLGIGLSQHGAHLEAKSASMECNTGQLEAEMKSRQGHLQGQKAV